MVYDHTKPSNIAPVYQTPDHKFVGAKEAQGMGIMPSTQGELIYSAKKTYPHSLGLSCAFRQWKAASHCRFLHGYALKVTIVFTSTVLDQNNWVIDFGALTKIKEKLIDRFDHKTIVAANDPHIAWFKEGKDRGTMDLIVLESLSIEKFAEAIFLDVEQWLSVREQVLHTQVESVEVSEHEGNAAIVRRQGNGQTPL